MAKIEVLKTRESEYAQLKSIEREIRITGGFWRSILDTNLEVSLLRQYEECEKTGRIDNFRRAAGIPVAREEKRQIAPDSDVYKWVEAASYALRDKELPGLTDKLNEVIDLIVAAQSEDGYLNTMFVGERVKSRFSNLLWDHELYCGGHLIQAALAHWRATGETELLNVGLAFANHICEYFGEETHQGTCGHPEIEMALVELYRETGETKYLNQAVFFINQRGRMPPILNGSSGIQDHLPINEQTEVAGHAVRQLYLMAGLADLYMETGDGAILSAIEQQWLDLTKRRMAITGGTGSRYAGESFGLPYELPDRTAYNETCAAIASFMFAWRLLHIRPNARIADLMEQTLYNGVLAGVSLDGQSYFYANPLEHPGDDSSIRTFYGSNQRTREMWDQVPCCPPNLARILASLPDYLYTNTQGTIYCHLFAQSEATFETKKGRIGLSQRTNYPWDGEVELRVETVDPVEHEIALRMPGFAGKAVMEINGEEQEVVIGEDGYVRLVRVWQSGDIITLQMELLVRKMASHSHLTSHAGSIALMRGPLVYCLEGVDHSDCDIFDLVLEKTQVFEEEFRPELLKGIMTLTSTALLRSKSPGLYFPIDGQEGESKEVAITAIPYFAWANRGRSSMKVWLPLKT